MVRGEWRTNRTMSGHTLDEEYGHEGVCSPRAMPAHSHDEPGPIPNLGYLSNTVTIERFEGILEEVHGCCR